MSREMVEIFSYCVFALTVVGLGTAVILVLRLIEGVRHRSASAEHLHDGANATHAQAMTSRGFMVDAGLASLLEALWRRGVETSCSCEGDTAVRHGVFGKTHPHPAFVTVTTFEDAVVLYRLVDDFGAAPAIFSSAEGCGSGPDLTVEFAAGLDWHVLVAEEPAA